MTGLPILDKPALCPSAQCSPLLKQVARKLPALVYSPGSKREVHLLLKMTIWWRYFSTLTFSLLLNKNFQIQKHVQQSPVVSSAIRQWSKDLKHLTLRKRATWELQNYKVSIYLFSNYQTHKESISNRRANLYIFLANLPIW